MAYLPVSFPSDIAPQPTGGPGWDTGIVTTLAGDEQRNQNWSESRHSFEMSQGIKRSEDFRAIGAHFRMARGRLHHFRVRDWSDWECDRGDGVLLELTSTTFQLAKQYGDEVGFLEQRRITRPIASSLQIWKNAVLQTVVTNYTLNAETGIVTFLVAPGAATIECAFEFDVPCRYDVDKLQAILVHLEDADESLISWTTVPLVEHRE